VTGTIIQPCSASGIVTDGIQAIMQLLQGLVTYTSPVEAFATGSRILIGENRPWSLDRSVPRLIPRKLCNYDVSLPHLHE